MAMLFVEMITDRLWELWSIQRWLLFHDHGAAIVSPIKFQHEKKQLK